MHYRRCVGVNLTKYLFICLVVSFGAVDLFAQPSIPVDPLTGRLQLSVPIWRLSDGPVPVDIDLTYGGGGIRVEDEEGSAGMGWFLQGGGGVVRNLRGLPDDYSKAGDLRKGWLNTGIASTINVFTPQADFNFSNCADEVADYNVINGLGYTKDPEPDVFSFSAPGISGQFVFDANGIPRPIPYQDVRIDVTKDGDGIITEFNITTNRGVVYRFLKGGNTTRTTRRTSAGNVAHFTSVYEYYKEPLEYAAEWYLRSIASNGRVINFSYQFTHGIKISTPVKVVDESGTISTEYFDIVETSARQITSITSPATQANFEWEGPRISRVTIEDITTQDERSFQFEYVYAHDYRDTNPAMRISKAWLRTIRQETNCQAYPDYSFAYQGVTGNFDVSPVFTTTLPFKDENFQDIYGYYNGTSETKIPDIYVYSQSDDAERYRLQALAGVAADVTLSGAGRTVNASTVADGSLTTIHYPTGSSVFIEYEPNSYYDAVASVSVPGPGIRTKKVRITQVAKGSEGMEYEYLYNKPDGTSSGRLTYRPVFAFADGNVIIRTLDNLAPEEDLLYSYTTVTQAGHGKTVYEFAVPAMYPSVSDDDWAATTVRIARPSNSTCLSLGNQHSGKFSFPFAPNANFDFERGLPLKILEYAEGAATPLIERTFSYQRLTPGITEVKGLRFEKRTNNFIYGLYSLKTNVGKVSLTETVKRADDANPSVFHETATTYTYSTIHQLLASVSTLNSDGVLYTKTYKHAKDFSSITNPSNDQSIALKMLNDQFTHGVNVEITESATQGTVTHVTGSLLILYNDFGNSRVLPAKQLSFPARQGFVPAFVETSGSGQHEFKYDDHYRLRAEYLGYNSQAQLASESSSVGAKTAVHYGFNGVLPVARILNAAADEAVYSSFDGVDDYSLSISGTGSDLVAGWIGKARSMSSLTRLSKSGVKKGSEKYRYSLWLKSSGTPNVTCQVKNGASIVTSATCSYTSGMSGNWQHFEGILDLAAAPAVFDVEIGTSAAVEIDEVRLMPAEAVMTTTLFEPLKGMSVQTDDRGVSLFTEYDELGRKKFIRNRDKDIIQLFEYRYKKEAAPKVSSAFTSSQPSINFKVGITTSFNAVENCLTGVSYQWKVNGTVAGTNATLAYTFASATQHTVELTVTHPDYGPSTTIVQYCVAPAALVFAITIRDHAQITPANTIFECASNFNKSFKALYQSGGCGNSDFYYTWEYRPTGSSVWYGFGDHTGEVDFNLSLQGYSIRCTIEQEGCIGEGAGCPYTYTPPVTAVTTVYYQEETYCP